MTMIRGTPLSEVISCLDQTDVSNIILFIIDGLRADAFYSALSDGSLPNLRDYMKRHGYLQYKSCITTFPCTTVSAHASLLTGTYPGYHGIVGNEWFIRKAWARDNPSQREELFRVTREYIKYSVRHPTADPGLANGFMSNEFFNLANADMYPVPTLYECFPDRSISIHEIISNGAAKKQNLTLSDFGGFRGYLATAVNFLCHIIKGRSFLSFPYHGFDIRGFHKLRQTLRQNQNSETQLMVVWLPAMDGFSHSNGAKRQKEFFRKQGGLIGKLIGNFDDDLKRTFNLLTHKGLDSSTLLVITADHGQYDCDPEKMITSEDIYRFLQGSTQLKGEKIPLDIHGRLDENARDATVVVAPNGGICYVYVCGDNGWGHIPNPTRLMPFAETFFSHPGVEIVLLRNPEDGYKVWKNGKALNIEKLPEDTYPLKEKRLRYLAECRRSGDIILSAKAPYYFGHTGYQGQHGRLNSEDSLVPLLFIHPNLSGDEISRTVQTIDVTPTLAKLSKYENNYAQVFNYRENRIRKLEQLFRTLEAYLGSDVYQMGIKNSLKSMERYYPGDQLRKDWEITEKDLSNNISRKLEVYQKNRLLDRETIAYYQRRLLDLYKKIYSDE